MSNNTTSGLRTEAQIRDTYTSGLQAHGIEGSTDIPKPEVRIRRNNNGASIVGFVQSASDEEAAQKEREGEYYRNYYGTGQGRSYYGYQFPEGYGIQWKAFCGHIEEASLAGAKIAERRIRRLVKAAREGREFTVSLSGDESGNGLYELKTLMPRSTCGLENCQECPPKEATEFSIAAKGHDVQSWSLDYAEQVANALNQLVAFARAGGYEAYLKFKSAMDEARDFKPEIEPDEVQEATVDDSTETPVASNEIATDDAQASVDSSEAKAELRVKKPRAPRRKKVVSE
jgi:hypothetical protein